MINQDQNQCDYQLQSEQQTSMSQYLDFNPFKGFQLHQELYRNQLIYSKLTNPSFLNLQSGNKKRTEKGIEKPLSLRLTLEFQSFSIIISHKKLHSSKGDILILPYITPQLQIYPGNVLKPQLANNVQKLIELNAKPGDLYMRKYSILQYSYVGFIKISSLDPLKYLSIGINSIFQKMKQKNKKFEIISLCYDSKFDIEKLLKMLMSQLQILKDIQQKQMDKKTFEVIVQDSITFQKIIGIVSSINLQLK